MSPKSPWRVRLLDPNDQNAYPYADNDPVNIAGSAMEQGYRALRWLKQQLNAQTCNTAACIGVNVAAGVAPVAAAAVAPELLPEVAGEESTALSTYRFTQEGESFFHYGYADQAGSFEQGLWPNSYATAQSDLTAQEAQEGLSLTHAAPPDAVYQVSPPAGTPVVVNPVTAPVPDLNLPGGLPEYNFPVGTPPGSVTGPFPLAQ